MAKKILYKKHLWRTIDGGFTPDENDPKIDNFIFENGFHNGPECVLCGLSFCEHCEPKEYDSECPVGYYKCDNCDGFVSKDAKYCEHCGKKFELLVESEEDTN